MKATGIVRRIDDLGRVVIPKEIRRTMRIREGDPLEIFTERDGEVIFKKYSRIGELNSAAESCAQSLFKTGGFTTIVFDRDSVISGAGISKRELEGVRMGEEIEAFMSGRGVYSYHSSDRKVYLFGDDGAYISVFAPIISEGDIIGGIASLRTDGKEPTETEEKLVHAAAMFLAKENEEP